MVINSCNCNFVSADKPMLGDKRNKQFNYLKFDNLRR